MRLRDPNIPAREPGKQLIPCRRSRSRVDVENHRDLGMLELDALCMEDVAPKQDLLSLRRELIAGMSRGMTRQRDELHAVDDWLGATKRMPLTGLDVGRCEACALWKNSCASFGALAAISGDNQKSLSAFAT